MKRVLRIAALIILMGAGYYVYRAADLYLYQAKYVYHPEKNWTKTPSAEGLAYENVELVSADGVKLSAWYIPSAENKGSVLFFHGNARNISSDMDAYQMFHRFGYNLLAIDYRGYGKSEGSPDEKGTYLDAEAAWQWLVEAKKEAPEKIVICGRSLGAAIAAELALHRTPRLLILEAAFTSLGDAGQEVYPYFPVKLLSKYRYDTLSKLPNIPCPVLIVHSREDELISFKHAERLYAAVPGKKKLVELGGPHRGGYKPTLGKYEREVESFLKE